MEIILVLAAVIIIGAVYWSFFRNDPVKMEETAPYKIEPLTPTIDPENKVEEVKTEVRVDPVAVALDLEPAVITTPAKKASQPRSSKQGRPAKSQTKPVAVKPKTSRRPRSKKS